MPSVPLSLPDPDRDQYLKERPNPLPQLLQTPSGLAILELQGTINMPSANADLATRSVSSASATIVGKVVFPDYRADDPTESVSWMKRVHLYIGPHQRLTGEVKKLTTPLAVVRRKMNVGHNPSLPENEELQIAEIINYKMIFSTRPEPVSE
ncbi:MAG: hypothetical protein Q9216_006720 [Gyalolechia sp. 2 TL-2023]